MNIVHQQVVYARRAMLWAALVGLFASVYLLIVYLTGGPIVCGVVYGCEIVRASKWAYTFGIPRPLLGVVFYGFTVGVLALRAMYPHWRPRHFYHLTILIGAVGFVESAFLTFVQWLDIKAFCAWCILSAIAATILFIACAWDRGTVLEEKDALHELKWIFWCSGAAIVVGAFVIASFTMNKGGGTKPNIQPSVLPSAGFTVDPGEIARIRSLILPEGLTVEGNASSTVTLVEFIDFQCPSCKVAHAEVQQVRDAFRGNIRFAWRMFPLPMHPDAAGAALGAVCADRQGKLFAYGDLLIANQNALKPADLMRYAERLGMDTGSFQACLSDKTAQEVVLKGVSDGQELGVPGTPTFFINESMIEGLPSAAQLKDLIDQSL